MSTNEPKPGSKSGISPASKAPGPAPERESTPKRPCPICGKPAVEKYHPFCSKRCADIDLNRWLSGAYAIPGRADEDEDGTETSSSRD